MTGRCIKMPYDMRQLILRSSITTDEAAAIMSGLAGPFCLSFIPESEKHNTDWPIFDLKALDDGREILVEECRMAECGGESASVVAQKLALLRHYEALIDQVFVNHDAILAELGKGERSVLKIDSGFNGIPYTYITLASFDEWVDRRAHVPTDGLLDSAVPSASGAPPVKNERKEKAPRTKQRDQEDAILGEIRRLGFDPLALPPRAPGKDGVKADVRHALNGQYPFEGSTTFDSTWERLRSKRLIREVETTPPK